MIALVWKATMILAAAFGVAACLRRNSAAVRHFVWTAALAAIMALPLSNWAPKREAIAAPAIVVAAAGESVTAATAPAPARTTHWPWLAIFYGAGLAAAASRFVVGAWRTSGMARRGTPSDIGDEFGARVIFSREAQMPLAWGIRRPVVVLPESAKEWPAARLRSVLLHEATHHGRRDLAAQAVGQAACCLYWFHPLAWLALGRQREERERACDDAVLRRGVAAHDYAAHLVEVVRSVAATRRRWADAPAMAEASSLEARVRSVLDRRANRAPLTRRAAMAIGAAALALMLPLSVVTVRAQARGALAGIVTDPSGARVPNCRVTAANLDAPKNVEMTTADMAGEYRFTNLPPGRYLLEFASAGFKKAQVDVTLVSGAVLRADGHLDIGGSTETLKVVGKRTAPIAPRAAAPQRIPVGGNVQPMRLVRQPRPEYPAELQQEGVEGTVIVKAVISTTGTVLNPQVVSNSDPRLAKLALDAVSRWLYSPALLNGQPVETETTINVEFQLDR